ncbi:MAG: fumarate reductase/succinate dehydrogenase flavoprotein subunit, partial [Candidatus Vogelbacteria bacterium]|nr:fumarate reductase/succinate dehydrogenase flavoprotein subunit [Candidatus Vogelbacteria bacterium]
GAMIEKRADGLEACLVKIKELQARAQNIGVEGDRGYNPGWQTARDIQFALKTSEIIVLCALMRQESRGAQWRSDFPDKDPEWGKKNLIAKKVDSALEITTRPVQEMPEHLAKLFEEG